MSRWRRLGEALRPGPGGLELLAIVSRVPRPIWRLLIPVLSAGVALHPPGPVRRWQHNAWRATGIRPGRRQTGRAVASWARNLMESLQLHRLTPEQALRMVEVDPGRARWLRDAVEDRGVVVALPHQGSWDLSGAWACASGMPVTTVAERLSPAEFELFSTARAAVGMTVLAHDEPRAIPRLLQAARSHHAVCLVSDRAITGHGTLVEWPTPQGPQAVRIPVGAAAVAQRAGVPLVPASSRFTRAGIALEIGPQIPTGEGPDGLARANQLLAEWFAASVAADVTDWHMLQPFFGLVEADAR